MKYCCFIMTLAIVLPVRLNAQGTAVGDKDYHVVYVELSDNNNRMGITNTLRSLYDKLISSKALFITYISNSDRGRIIEGEEDLEELFRLIRDMNISLPNVEYDIRQMIKYWNRNDIVRQDSLNKTYLIYRRLVLHYFVSPSYYDLSGDKLSYKLLNVMNLNEFNDNADQVQIRFYFSESDVSDSFRKSMALKTEKMDNNPYGFRFTTY